MELQLFNIRRAHQFPLYFKSWRLLDEKLVLLLSLPKTDETEVEETLENSHLQKFIDAPAEIPDFDFSTLSKSERAQSLLIEGIILTFKPSYDQTRNPNATYGEFKFFDMELGDDHILLQAVFGDPILEDEKFKSQLRCLLLAVDQSATDNFYHFLVLSGDGTVVERQGMIKMQNSRASGDLLDHVLIMKERIILK